MEALPHLAAAKWRVTPYVQAYSTRLRRCRKCGDAESSQSWGGLRRTHGAARFGIGSGMSGFVYLDHNATTRVRDVAAAAMMATLGSCGNPSSVHRAGRAARAALAEARERIAAAIGLPKGGMLVFTSGGTEANHLALKAGQRPVWRSAIEHDSVRAAVPDAAVLPVGPDGIVRLESLAGAAGALVSVMAANNETGIIQPIAAVVAAAQRHGALVHSDAVQAIGKIPFDMADLGLDLVSVSAHKFGGPAGIGALAVAPGIDPAPLLTGGGQERGWRAGTENLPGIMGFAAAIEAAVAELDRYAQLARLRDDLERRLSEAAPDAIFFRGPRLPNTSCVALPGVLAETQVMALDLAGIGVSAGAACSSGKVRPSHVLAAMGMPQSVARSSIRISLGRDTNAADIDRCVAAWSDLAQRTEGTRRAA
jgi:cysteine desulfurase